MDFNEIVGHEHAKRALEVALAGHHSCCLIGPKGFGSGMLVYAAITASYEMIANDRNPINVRHARPCECGWFGDSVIQCTCSVEQIEQVHRAILEQEFDIHIEVPRLKSEEIVQIGQRYTGEYTNTIMDRVTVAQKRFGAGEEAPLSISKRFVLADDCRDLMRAAVGQLQLSASSYTTVLRLARTIADLDGKDKIGLAHVAEALQYRALDRTLAARS